MSSQSGQCVSPWLYRGSIYTRLHFELRPYRYLAPDWIPTGEAGEIVTPPFAVSLFADETGAGTEESPIFLGGMFDVYACTVEEDAETIVLGMDNEANVMRCVQAISTGTELTLTIYDNKAQPPVKLRLQLPNDQEFAGLYKKLLSTV